ncbi:MAG: hypothetical protein ACL93V_04110 [Candidatus Electrothrix sp. YB6]
MKKVFAAAAMSIVLLVPFSVALSADAQEAQNGKPQIVEQELENMARKFEAKAEQNAKEELKRLMEAGKLQEELEAARKTQKTDKKKPGEAQSQN